MSEDRSRPIDEFYRRLEVVPEASRDDIVRAYHRLAHSAHPDSHPGDPDAPRRFRELTEAYDVLADHARRASYDRAQHGVPVRVHSATWVTPTDAARVVGIGSSPRPSAPLRVGPVHIDPDPAAAHATMPNLDSAAAAMAELFSRLLAAWRSPW